MEEFSCFRAHLGRRDEDRRENRGTGGQGSRRGKAFGRICAFVTEREGQERGDGDRVTGGGLHFGAFSCFHAFERILDEERETGGRRAGQGGRRGRAFGCILMLAGAFWTER